MHNEMAKRQMTMPWIDPTIRYNANIASAISPKNEIQSDLNLNKLSQGKLFLEYI